MALAFHGEGPEELLWHGEAGEQALKVCATCQPRHAPGQFRLGSPWGTQQQQVLPCQCRKQQQSYLCSLYMSEHAWISYERLPQGAGKHGKNSFSASSKIGTGH